MSSPITVVVVDYIRSIMPSQITYIITFWNGEFWFSLKYLSYSDLADFLTIPKFDFVNWQQLGFTFSLLAQWVPPLVKSSVFIVQWPKEIYHNKNVNFDLQRSYSWSIRLWIFGKLFMVLKVIRDFVVKLVLVNSSHLISYWIAY